MEIRPLTLDDHEQAQALGAEAFGPPSSPRPRPDAPPPGVHSYGAFDGDRLAAKLTALELASWFDGVAVPTCGIAGVAVAAAARGRGLLRPLLDVALADAAERGEPVSTLFPTAPGIYRSAGYEVIASFDVVELPTAELARLRTPAGTTLRPAEVGDAAEVARVHATWAAEQNGPFTRTGPRFASDASWLDDHTGVTLAEQDGAVVGYASWTRSGGYGDAGRLDVEDLLALTADGYRALWAMVGSFASVTRTVRLCTSGHDPARLVLPGATWDVVERHPYMLRVLDVDTAVLRPRPDLADPLGAVDLTPQGLALRYAGAQTCGNLRLLGHLTGPTDHDAALDTLGTRPLHVRDYF